MSTRSKREPEQIIGAYVVLIVPARMTTEEVERELQTCISFGKPEVTVISNVAVPDEDAEPERVKDVHVTDGKL